MRMRKCTLFHVRCQRVRNCWEGPTLLTTETRQNSSHVSKYPGFVLPNILSYKLNVISGRSQFVKRDTLLEIERECQLRWERDAVFQMDAPQVRSRTTLRLSVYSVYSKNYKLVHFICIHTIQEGETGEEFRFDCTLYPGCLMKQPSSSSTQP